MEDRLSRPTFLRCATAVSSVAMSIMPAGADAKPHPRAAVQPPAGGKYREAPMLAARVAAGKLPPVEQRLPAQPFVWQVAQIGR
ncbi:MAG: hypothetical protein WB341_15360 [Terracidiphilus sp.]